MSDKTIAELANSAEQALITIWLAKAEKLIEQVKTIVPALITRAVANSDLTIINSVFAIIELAENLDKVCQKEDVTQDALQEAHDDLEQILKDRQE